nr:RecName: Full=29 kDa immunogenic protein [Porphyromonas gingivalis]
ANEAKVVLVADNVQGDN